MIRPDTTERQIQIELEAEFFRNGAERTAYDSIVGGGPNSALFHFTPSGRAFKENELVLIDAGAEYRGYASDVTRTYSTSTFTPEQRDIYAIVLETNKRAIERCKPGVEYKDIHLGAALDLARGLVDLGLLIGNPESLVERGSHALFYPHGVGHLVGLGVRDASGYMPGRKPEEKLGLRYLRIDLPLVAGYTVTIEPGIYFIPVLLQNRELRVEHRDAVNWEKVDKMMDFGGIRIEDNVHVTTGEPEVLTRAIPK
jgi:Xaa-Pro aminopeptidase